MSQLILQISDDQKAEHLIAYLKTLEYITIEELIEEDIIVSESEKELMRNRLNNAVPEDFKPWEEVLKKLNETI